jgi:DNA (cytosine-5)-methyltransferase 1
MTTPRALDLFCCAGGASMGYHRAGFAVTGVDLHPQPHYPFEFHQADALEFVKEHGHEFDLIAASPPCHDHSDLAARAGRDGSGWLLAATRDALIATGKPYVLENVEGAPMRADITLCGSMFGLGAAGFVLARHRLFESNMPLTAPPDRCAGHQVANVHGGGPQNYGTHHRGGRGIKLNAHDARTAMGIDWFVPRGWVNQAIPPAYTEHIGRQIITHLGAPRVRT